LSRRLRLLAVTVLAVVALAGCQTDPNTAAYVGDQQITAAHLDRVIAVEDPQTRPQVRQNALNVLVLTAMLRGIADDLGVTVPPGAVAASLEDPQIQQQAVELGVTAEAIGTFDTYRTLTIRGVAERVTDGAREITAEQQAEVQRLLTEMSASAADEIRVNPRYGTFDVQQGLVLPTVEPGVKQVSTPREVEQPAP
jgi:type IV pilus biogenesis protein CpaD/CtpE